MEKICVAACPQDNLNLFHGLLVTDRYFDGYFAFQIAVEVEDDFADGIVQAEEEEEERLEPEAFSGGAQAVFRSRERVPRMTAFRGSVESASQPSSGKKRKLDGSAISGN